MHTWITYVKRPAPVLDNLLLPDTGPPLVVFSCLFSPVGFFALKLGIKSKFHHAIRSPAVTIKDASFWLKRISLTHDSWSLMGGYNLRHSLPTSKI